MSETKTGGPKWKRSNNVAGPARPGPVVKVAGPTMTVAAVKVSFTLIYPNSSKHKIKKGDMARWARGTPAYAGPEWVVGRENNFPAVVVRNDKCEFRVTLTWPSKTAVSGNLTVDGRLLTGEDDPAARKIVGAKTSTKPFSFPAGKDLLGIDTELVDLRYPNTIGRYVLELDMTCAQIPGSAPFTTAAAQANIAIYVIFGMPFKAEDDDPERSFKGTPVGKMDTVTGTPMRFNKLMSLFGVGMNHPVTNDEDLRDLVWRMHTGINDYQNPPYFDAVHDIHLTDNGEATAKFVDFNTPMVGGKPLDLDDQWLMWLPTPEPHWNTAACIGYVQLLKTAAAAVGIFVRRAWVVPRTLKLPTGDIPFKDSDLWCLGRQDQSKTQRLSLNDSKGKPHTATLVLMEPDRAFENFEACLFTKDGHFLPGGYRTTSVEKDAPGFPKEKGFISALAVLQWWCRTKRNGGKFKRFMCWADIGDGDKKPEHFWDRDGKYYAAADFEKIRDSGKEVPPPSQAPVPTPAPGQP